MNMIDLITNGVTWIFVLVYHCISFSPLLTYIGAASIVAFFVFKLIGNRNKRILFLILAIFPLINILSAIILLIVSILYNIGRVLEKGINRVTDRYQQHSVMKKIDESLQLFPENKTPAHWERF